MKKPLNDLDYVELFASKLKEDNHLFDQQKKIIEAQLKMSLSLFRNLFKDRDFKFEAREYLRKRLIIK